MEWSHAFNEEMEWCSGMEEEIDHHEGEENLADEKDLVTPPPSKIYQILTSPRTPQREPDRNDCQEERRVRFIDLASVDAK